MPTTEIQSPQLSPSPPNSIPQWQPATWKEYLAYVEDPNVEEIRVFFNDGYLWVDMGNEGINHARFNRLFSMLFLSWFARTPDVIWEDLGGCVIEKPKQRGGAPDLMLYIGEGAPQWTPGEPRRIDFNKWRVPDLVGEISDTTLATDLDEKKCLYAALGIPEYWVVDVKGFRIFAFYLQEDGTYQQVGESSVLKGCAIALLDRTLEQMQQGTNGGAALWFSQQIATLS
ncbi:Uma2 family endonuclease [Lusitaniella coriacea LEGE 07157]|uniref:Uma2 family endonuclease n=1 Tax=Lusitaniella coriacea LEGE 07157 TaxID=945747 RepID=A0A8J7J1P1_9CYAN|nr:Uma2 family endonuclease [Lusitaniella coriacea]MBE9115909.1 Uma2 family endonuclease [Lusitaniella coriacea LEGE 07157]